MTKIFSANLFDGERFAINQCIQIENGIVSKIENGSREQADFCVEGLLAPGFIDVQVNGGGGVLFNNQPDVDALHTMFNAHQQFGTTCMLPTLITDSAQIMQKAADAIAKVVASGHGGIVGVHFEGPYLSGPKKGIHPERHIRPISQQEMAILLRKDLGQVCVTLAPENVPLEKIKELVDNGVIVCLGHSNASAEQVQSALKAGARGFTHLYNAMSPLASRESGMVGAALLDNDSYCGLIVDRHHVSMSSCQLAVKCKTPQRIMLVTDAMSHVGSNQQVLHFAGVEIQRHDDKLTIPAGNLAGSTLDMASAVENTVKGVKVPLGEALQMASLTPAKFLAMHQRRGKIAPGYRADWVVLDDDLKVNATYSAGQCVYNRSKTAKS